MKRRHNIAAGNWKMNKNYEEGRDLAYQVVERLTTNNALVIIATPFIHLKAVDSVVRGVSNVKLAAQNCHHEVSGAYTGEISVHMLKSVGVDFVILGHSERREYFNETDDLLAKKTDAVLAGGLRPIFCCGESLDIRESGKHVQHVADQIKNGLFHLSAEDFAKVVIAYEPIWAIGTGVTASPEQAQEMHAEIRQLMTKKYGAEVAAGISILYGGSVKPANAEEIFGKEDVDGGLVGGASLKAEDFVAIAGSFTK